MLLGLTACAVIDQYSSRAVVFNLQAEQVEQQGLLLNIVRASLRRPMQFTGLQSITGTANTSASINASSNHGHNFPYVVPPANNFINRTLTYAVGGNASMGGGDTFTVPVLDTQEFYQGLLTPISGQLLDLYLQAGYPHDVMYNLTVERIILKRTDGHCRPEIHTPDCELIIRNYAPRDTDLDLFQSFMGYFIWLGLSTEPLVEEPNLAKKGGDSSSKSSSSKGGSSSKSSSDSGSSSAGPRFKPYVFCFAPTEASVYRYFNREVLCGHPGTPLILRGSEIGRQAVVSGVPLLRSFIDQVYANVIAPRLGQRVGAEGYRFVRDFAGKKVSVSFGTRSIEEILYYLGEVVRRSQHPPQGEAPRNVQVRFGPPQNTFPIQLCPYSHPIHGYACSDLFIVHTGAPVPGAIAVNYEGNSYWISPDTSTSWSMPVLDIVKQLLAVNTSAKELPASNIISVLSTQ
jgi:hypothetical protein